MNPYFTLGLYIFAMIIIGVVSFYSEIMIRYENQSTLEAIYAINTILLVFISSILKIKSSLQSKTLKADLSDAGSEIFVSLDYNPLILA